MKNIISIICSGLFGALIGGTVIGSKMNDIVESKDNDVEKFRIMYYLMERWMRIKQNNGSVTDYFNIYGYKSIAIYGMAEIGQILMHELEGSNIKILYGIDKNTKVSDKINIISPDSDIPDVDVIVVTAIAYFDEIEELLSSKCNAKIISLEDIIYEVI